MARQAFFTLVARLRGLDWVNDPNVHYDVSYILHEGDSGSIADALAMPFAGRPSERPPELSSPLPHPHVLEIDYIWAPCMADVQAVARNTLRATHLHHRRNWSRIITARVRLVNEPRAG